jgi:hypothetical protein
MEILKEVTDWNFPSNTYLLNDKGLMVAYESKVLGVRQLSNPLYFDKRYRKFEKVKHAALEKIAEALKPIVRKDGIWVESEKDSNKKYFVETASGKFSCTCPGYGFRGKCKHSEKIAKEMK